MSAVVDTAFTWGNDAPPRTPWHETLIYEVHVEGFTKLHPEVPEALRGTYAGMASDAAVRHLKALGVTAVELLPVHHHVYERHLVERGLSKTGATTPWPSSPPMSATHRPPRRSTPCESSRRWRRQRILLPPGSR